jgi:hypothetical protein
LQAGSFAARFKSGKDVLMALIGVLGTILGFYFGAATDGKSSDAQLAEIRALGGIAEPKSVDLTGTNVSDKDLVSLKALPALERLYLNNTAITDAGLPYLAELKNLKYLSLFGTKVKDKTAVEKLITASKDPFTGKARLSVFWEEPGEVPPAPQGSPRPAQKPEEKSQTPTQTKRGVSPSRFSSPPPEPIEPKAL